MPDIEQAARDHSRAFGSGPFFTFPQVPLTSSVHRGVERAFDHSSAYGQWGNPMAEFVALHSSDAAQGWDGKDPVRPLTL